MEVFMKSFIALPLIALLAFPAIAGSTKKTTTRTYESTTSGQEATSGQITSPVNPRYDSEMIEAEEEAYDSSLDQEAVEQQRMEEDKRLHEQRMEERNQNTSIESDDEDLIDYKDRTRTNRERKALNTGGDASDDQ